jgi:hypothetical protein
MQARAQEGYRRAPSPLWPSSLSPASLHSQMQWQREWKSLRDATTPPQTCVPPPQVPPLSGEIRKVEGDELVGAYLVRAAWRMPSLKDTTPSMARGRERRPMAKSSRELGSRRQWPWKAEATTGVRAPSRSAQAGWSFAAGRASEAATVAARLRSACREWLGKLPGGGDGSSVWMRGRRRRVNGVGGPRRPPAAGRRRRSAALWRQRWGRRPGRCGTGLTSTMAAAGRRVRRRRRRPIAAGRWQRRRSAASLSSSRPHHKIRRPDTSIWAGTMGGGVGGYGAEKNGWWGLCGVEARHGWRHQGGGDKGEPMKLSYFHSF